MRKSFIFFLSGIITFALFSGCARSYRAINPSAIYYQNKQSIYDSVTISYQYDVLFDTNNKRYSKKEKLNNYAMVAVSITNKSAKPIDLTPTNLQITTSSGITVPFIDISSYSSVVKQNEIIYLLYGLGGLGFSYTELNGEPVEAELYFNPIPLVIGLGNSVFAMVANNKCKKNLQSNTIFGKSIMPNSTLYGLILIPENNYPELRFYLTLDN